MSAFKFELGADVVLVTSMPLVIDQLRYDKEEEAAAAERAANPPKDGEEELAYMSGRFSLGIIEAGTVIGRAEYITAEPSYLVRYRDGSGRQVEEFVPESGLTTWEDCEAEFAAEEAGERGAQEDQVDQEERREGDDRPGTDVLDA